MATTVSAAILPDAAPDLGQRAGARVTPVDATAAGVTPAGAASGSALEPGELVLEGAYCQGSLSFRMLCLRKVPVLCPGSSLSMSCLIALACCSLQLRFAMLMMLWCSLTMPL